ncbi:type IV pilus assembly protein PilV [Natronocella acetinitrilica]|uniref:Type IV pilus assembly protein PilV n=1 Tax=Natronocella acetinitrilica TaxID=414046 RepID=A0AAE3G3T4_9GAMM|nr:type IV pilus modification protein PilV [Natronocella acetinitrilica]MCP1674564.1 type IV pilus assembly protein PilV [Natronocella acetinitrilica]
MSERRARGFTLIEVLVALVIVSIALLGLASLQLRTTQHAYASYQASMASVLARDIEVRVRLNAAAGGHYAITAIETRAGQGEPGCLAEGCPPAALARHDLAVWARALTEALGRGASASLARSEEVIGGRSLARYTLEISWPERLQDGAPVTFRYQFATPWRD